MATSCTQGKGRGWKQRTEGKPHRQQTKKKRKKKKRQVPSLIPSRWERQLGQAERGPLIGQWVMWQTVWLVREEGGVQGHQGGERKMGVENDQTPEETMHKSSSSSNNKIPLTHENIFLKIKMRSEVDSSVQITSETRSQQLQKLYLKQHGEVVKTWIRQTHGTSQQLWNLSLEYWK